MSSALSGPVENARETVIHSSPSHPAGGPVCESRSRQVRLHRAVGVDSGWQPGLGDLGAVIPHLACSFPLSVTAAAAGPVWVPRSLISCVCSRLGCIGKPCRHQDTGSVMSNTILSWLKTTVMTLRPPLPPRPTWQTGSGSSTTAAA